MSVDVFGRGGVADSEDGFTGAGTVEAHFLAGRTRATWRRRMQSWIVSTVSWLAMMSGGLCNPSHTRTSPLQVAGFHPTTFDPRWLVLTVRCHVFNAEGAGSSHRAN